jgi:transcriptional antiterminator RfaH
MPDVIQIEAVAGSRWTAIHARPRCEKQLESFCRKNGIPCYLPLRRRAKRYQRRTVETFLPMFPGYVFARLEPDDKGILYQSNRIAAILPVSETEEPRLISELRSIQILEQASLEEQLMVNPELKTGDVVLITAGPLQGTCGIVEQRRNTTRVTVNVEILGQSVSAELDVGEVEIDRG